ncbi:hypothetical protein JCM4814A_90220 [Streptomyces phaeofaciens JCM 4814]|uniref:Uncharacterized protein n=1 Tax=Streptomyces phaeofaciens TaxID=68254 RepID=A0A918HNP7_9ACTN|nr:hypothetical protein GCM10010226_68680 [Streptomyces phaeofaciens]
MARGRTRWHQGPVGRSGPFRIEWAGRSAHETLSAREIADHATTVGAARASFRENTGSEPGDPARAAAAIVTAVTADNPAAPARQPRLRRLRWESSMSCAPRTT